MSLMPGIVGQKTELTDGVKVNTITELTPGVGIALQGRTNGVAAATGYVGEVVTHTAATGIYRSAPSFTYNDAGAPSVTLTAGTWLLFGTAIIYTSVARGGFVGFVWDGNIIAQAASDISVGYQNKYPMTVVSFTGASRIYNFYYQGNGGNVQAGGNYTNGGSITAVRIA